MERLPRNIQLERHNNARYPCCPPTHHCDNCNKGFASYQSLWKHEQKGQGPSNYVNYPVRHKRPADISTVSLEIPPTFVAAAKESSLEPRPKHPKIQALLDEIVNDDPKKHVPPQAIHQGFCIVPPTTTSPSPKKVSTPPSTPPHPPKKMFLSSQKHMLSKPSTEVIAT